MKTSQLTTAATASGANRDARIHQVAKQFEGLLYNELLKSMRRTVPDGNAGLGRQMFTSMLDDAIAESAAKRGGLGIAGLVAKQLGAASSTTPVPEQARATLRDGNWVRPVQGPLSVAQGQRFGAARPGERPERCGAGHCGVDVARSAGQQVHAAGRGRVVRIDAQPDSRAGNWVEIAHANGTWHSRYMHLQDIAPHLRLGQTIPAGAVIGQVGASGTAAEGAHLHFELLYNGGAGPQHVDPETFLRHWPTPATFFSKDPQKPDDDAY